MAYVRPDAGGGLSLSVAPRWGADTRDVDMIWREDTGIAPDRRSADQPGTVRARIGYGLSHAGPRSLSLTPFAEADLSGADRRSMRIGARLGARGGMLGVEFAGERRQDPNGPTNHRVGFLGRMRF